MMNKKYSFKLHKKLLLQILSSYKIKIQRAKFNISNCNVQVKEI